MAKLKGIEVGQLDKNINNNLKVARFICGTGASTTVGNLGLGFITGEFFILPILLGLGIDLGISLLISVYAIKLILKNKTIFKEIKEYFNHFRTKNEKR